jgi:hypothetical protein
MSVKAIINRHGVSVQFERATTSDSPTGAKKRTWANHGTALTGWLQPAMFPGTGFEVVFEKHGNRSFDATHKLYLHSNPNVQEGDRVTISGRVYNVITSAHDQAGVGQVWRVDLQSDG